MMAVPQGRKHSKCYFLLPKSKAVSIVERAIPECTAFNIPSITVAQCFSVGGSQDCFEWLEECTVKETSTNLILFF